MTQYDRAKSRMNVYDLVSMILIEDLDIRKRDIRPTAHLIDNLGLDSADIVALCVAIEADFGIKLADDFHFNIAIHDLTTAISRRIRAR